MFAYNHPLITEGAGRIKTDALNDERINIVIDRFEEWAKKNEKAELLQYNVDANQLAKSKYMFPLAGAAVLLFFI
jgi:alpha-L-arabinofuranosidase